MSELLLRVAKRRASWEAGVDIETLLNAEFRTRDGEPDLTVSVYAIGRSDVVRIIAEHYAGSNLDPPRGGVGVDLKTDRDAVATDGETGFQFTIRAHRELRFQDEASLRGYLEDSILPDVARRIHAVGKPELREYVKSRRTSEDPEWVEFLGKHPKW